MRSPFKNSKNNEKGINQSLHKIIYTKVTGNINNSKKEDKTIPKCIELFKKGADPNVLIELEKSLSEQTELKKLPKEKEEYQKYYKDYIDNFLPALKKEVMRLKVELPVFKNEIEQSQGSPTRRAQILQIISDITNRSSDKDSKIEEQPINSIKEEIPVSSTGMTENNVESLMTQNQTQQELESLTKEEVCASDSDSGIGSPRTSKESLKSPVSSRRSSLTLVTSTSSEESVNSIPSVAEENNNLQKENENQMQPEQVVKEELKLNSEKSGSTLPGKEELKLEEQKKEAVLSEQSAPDNNNNDKEVLSKKQPNNRNLHVALVAGCALLAVGCLVAAAIARSGILCVIGAVFAIAAITTWCLTPSSELTSTNLSRPVDDKSLQHCKN